MIATELKQDYQVLQERSCLLGVSEEKIERARNARKSLVELLGDDEIKQKALIDLMGNMGVDAEVIRAIDALESVSSAPREIVSYIAHGNGGVCLVTPIQEGENGALTESLDKKLVLIIDHGSVLYNTQKQGEKTSATPREIYFSSDPDLKNGFIVYMLVPESLGCQRELATSLVDKLTQLQPEGFDRAKLTHVVKEVEPNVLKYFLQKINHHMKLLSRHQNIFSH